MATEDMNGVRLSTPNNISYKLLNGFPKFGGDIEALVGEEEVVVHSDDLEAFLLECIPRANHVTSKTLFTMELPRKMPGFPAMSCVKFEVSPCDDSRPIDPFQADPAFHAGAAAGTYGPLVKVHLWYSAVSRTFARETTVGVGAEYLHIPPNNTWTIDPPESASTGLLSFNPLTGLIGVTSLTNSQLTAIKNQDNLLGAYKLIPTAEWTYKLQPHGLPEAGWANIYALLGKINSRRSPALCENAIVDTVLFTGVTATRIYSNYKYPGASWAVELKFSQRCIKDGDYCYTWNHVYSSSLSKWVKLTRAMKNPETGQSQVSDPKKYLFDSDDIASLLDSVIIANP